MTAETATLHMVCGKIGAGKSTLAASLAQQQATILIAEDDWLKALFDDQLETLKDYARCSRKLRQVLAPHVSEILRAGLSVVLDFPANTVDQRAWMRALLDMTEATHQMHVLETPDAVCLARLQERNATGAHPFQVSDAQFAEMSRHFVRPTPEEGFTLVLHDVAGTDAR